MQGWKAAVIVFSYFDASANVPDQGQVIRLWHDSWKRHGWTPRLLNPRNARLHPWFERAVDKLGAAIEAPNFARWFALDRAASGTALFVHYDVMNFGLRPFRVTGPLSFYGEACQGWSREALRFYLRHLRRPVTDGVPALIRHRDPLSVGFLALHWDRAPLVHFSREACNCKPKHRVILDCGRRIY